jgi:hypothetical protein
MTMAIHIKANLKKQLLIYAVLCLTLISQAATQGTLGTTSTGSLNISATVQDFVIISGLTDIALGTYSGTGTMAGSSTFCVYRNGTGKYSARLTGSGGITAGFFIKNGAVAEMAYTATFTHGVTAVPATSGVTMGTAGSPLTGHSTSQTCGGGTNGNIAISISQATAQAAPTGVYTGILTVLISPL